MKLYFVRHGESEANLLRVFSNRDLKHNLTETGRLQAMQLAQSLEGNTALAGIYTSPLLRARQTAEVLATELQVPYEITGALREYDCGILEGRSDDDSWRAYRAILDAWLVRHDWEARIEGGESFADIQRRFCPFIETLVQQHQTSDTAFILVGHGGTYRCMLPLILDNIDFAFALANSMSHTAVVVAETGGEGLNCLQWGDITLSGQITA